MLAIDEAQKDAANFDASGLTSDTYAITKLLVAGDSGVCATRRMVIEEWRVGSCKGAFCDLKRRPSVLRCVAVANFQSSQPGT